jgi:hypothetical protein
VSRLILVHLKESSSRNPKAYTRAAAAAAAASASGACEDESLQKESDGS